MTAPSDSPPRVFADLQDAIQSLRDSGLRLSTPRRLVLEALFAADGPVSATHLSRKLSLDESSVYRNLEILEHRGIVRHLHLGHSPGLYVLTTEQELEYLYCERCTRVTAVSPERLEPIRRQIQNDLGYTPRFTHFAIVGICQDCAAARSPTPSSRDHRNASAERHARSTRQRSPTNPAKHEHLHSHGDYVHSHPSRAGHSHPPAGEPPTS